MSTAKWFRVADRKGMVILEALREFLVTELCLRRQIAIFQQDGGGSGDLHKEIIEYEVYCCDSGTAMVHVYSVIDESTNGHAHFLSVLVALADKTEKRGKLLAFLENGEFVSSHSSFRERPAGYKTFRSWLDDIPENYGLTRGFKEH